MLARIAAIAPLSACALALAGCATFSDYNSDTRSARRSFESGDTQAALDSLAPGVENELDGLCFTLERGVIAQAARNYQLSQAEFERAEKKIDYFEDRAASPLGVSQYVGSILLNEKTIPYKGEDFERILVPVFNCRNYLFRDQLEEAMVEVRKIWFQQDRARQLHAKELASADEAANQRKVARGDLPGVQKQVVYPPEALASPESVYELTYAHYLSALVSERTGNWDDAVISLKSAAKIRPDLSFISSDVTRLERIAGHESAPPQEGDGAPAETGSLALLFDCGLAPHKNELKVIFPTYHSLGAIAIPIYERSPNPARAARLVIGPYSFTTATLTDVEAVAFKYHHDHLPLIILKQAIRCAVKIAEGEATAYGVKEGLKAGKGKGREGAALADLAGWGAGLAVGVANIVTEQADLRAWLTLPQSFQATRAFVPVGEYPVRVELLGSGGGVLSVADLGVVSVKKGELKCVQARSVGASLYVTQPH